ncbi:MAG: hypothetical protein WA790_13550 [Sulfitobacter sp.]
MNASYLAKLFTTFLVFALTAAASIAQEQFYTDTWGYDYEEARWDLLRNGEFESRVFVGQFENGTYYFGMMRNTFDPIVQVLGASVEFADGSTQELNVSNCYLEGCLNQYADQFGAPGTYLEFAIKQGDLAYTFSALKAGKYIIFRYRTESSAKQGRFKNNTLSLKGSRKALELLEQGGTATPVAPIAVPSDTVSYLMSALNNNWAFASGGEGMQQAKQRFKKTEDACTFHVFINHPNGGKTTFEVDFRTLDANRIEWPKDFFKDEKLPFFNIASLGSREVVKEWIDYPDGTSEFKRKAEVSLYFPLDSDVERLRGVLRGAIAECLRNAG